MLAAYIASLVIYLFLARGNLLRFWPNPRQNVPSFEGQINKNKGE